MSYSSYRLSQQFQGFLDTPSLWITRDFFDFPQIELPKIQICHLHKIELKIPRRLILGKRAECFFQYCIEKFSEETIIANNIQIRWEKQTIGEIDFLLRNKKTYSISHVEVVYKFYLYDPAFPLEKERWIGPNRKDSLVKKLSKLRKQQFPLLYRNETKAYLQNLGISSEEIRQKVCFRANLFVPLHLKEEVFPEINNSAIKGFWIKQSEFTEISFGCFMFFTPKKPDWTIDPQHNSKWYSFSEIGSQLESLLEQKISPLVWMKKGDRDFCRFFIVWW